MPPQRRKPDTYPRPEDALTKATSIGPPDLADPETLADFLADRFPMPEPGDLGGALGLGTRTIGTGVRRAHGLAKRIAKGGQSGVDVEHKVQRFRSPAGDFVRFRNKWWRLQPFKADATELTLEDLGPGEKTLKSKPINTLTIAAKDFYKEIMKANEKRLKAKLPRRGDR